MARDAITRQYDVEKNRVTLTCADGKEGYRPGLITFHAKKGKSIDLTKIRESIAATRLSDGTAMSVDYLEITALGAVEAGDDSARHVFGRADRVCGLRGRSGRGRRRGGEPQRSRDRYEQVEGSRALALFATARIPFRD